MLTQRAWPVLARLRWPVWQRPRRVAPRIKEQPLQPEPPPTPTARPPMEEPAAPFEAAALTDALALRLPLRRALKALLPQPGSGPSERTMNEGWFCCELIGVTVDGRKVRGLLRDQGDPGNRATVKFLCEAALCLALNAGELPGGAQRGGLLTPATGLGDVLAERLYKAGVVIEIGG